MKDIPQILIALVLSFLGVLFYFFQPKNINAIYGYRTTRSMLSEFTWKAANRLSSIILMWSGIVIIIIHVLFIIILPELVKLRVIIFLFNLVFSFVLNLLLVEKHLKKHFDQDGNLNK
jgi:uncharacterized membrane protein